MRKGSSYIISFVPRFRSFLRRAKEDRISAFAAQSAFFALLSLVPFLLLFISVLLLFEQADSDLILRIYDFLPTLLGNFLKSSLSPEILRPSSGGVTLISLATALWASSRATFALMQGLNSVSRVNETRGYIRLRVVAALYTLVFIMLLLVAFALLLAGLGLDVLVQRLFPDANLLLLLVSCRSLLSVFLLTGLFMLMFAFLPCKREKLFTRLPGALVASVGWLVFSKLFSLYVMYIADYSRLYGSLAALALIMLWLYFCMYILFLGAELNEYNEN